MKKIFRMNVGKRLDNFGLEKEVRQMLIREGFYDLEADVVSTAVVLIIEIMESA